MKQLLLISTYISLLLNSCQKEKLPKLTQEGKNTFGCKVNGKNWVPHGGGGFGGVQPVDGGYQATYNFNTTRNNVFIRAYDGNSSIFLYLRSVEQPGTYLLNSNTLNMPDEKDPLNYG